MSTTWAAGDEVLGTLSIAAPITFRKTYETAAWWTELEVAPCEVDVIEHRYRFNGHARTEVLVRFTGAVTGSFFGAGSPHAKGSPLGHVLILATFDHFTQQWRGGSYGRIHATRAMAIHSGAQHELPAARLELLEEVAT